MTAQKTRKKYMKAFEQGAVSLVTEQDYSQSRRLGIWGSTGFYAAARDSDRAAVGEILPGRDCCTFNRILDEIDLRPRVKLRIVEVRQLQRLAHPELKGRIAKRLIE